MKYLVTFEEGDGQFIKGQISNIYGVSNAVESGLVERTQANSIRPFMRFYGNGKNVDKNGTVVHGITSPDFVSKEYPSLKDMFENEGRYLLIEPRAILKKPFKYKKA